MQMRNFLRIQCGVSRHVRYLTSIPEGNMVPKKTALYDLHVYLGGKMVPFANYLLPVQYKDSVIDSHLHCRKAASIFDVSHMGQIRVFEIIENQSISFNSSNK